MTKRRVPTIIFWKDWLAEHVRKPLIINKKIALDGMAVGEHKTMNVRDDEEASKPIVTVMVHSSGGRAFRNCVIGHPCIGATYSPQEHSYELYKSRIDAVKRGVIAK